MKGVSVLFFLGISLNWTCAQFLNNRPFPTYSLENMPKTDFTCREKILGGYYADAETNCQMFHICVKVAGVGVQDFRFLCPNGTAFDQDHQICAEWEDIDCDASTLYYSSDNFDLYRIGSGFESKAQRYGEEEETFALQRAETGDARINREQQSLTVNQKKESPYFNTLKQKKKFSNQNANNNNQNANNNNQNSNNFNGEKDIFKGSSSSNFYNNRNNGKERDEDYDDNVNVNQNTDYSAKRKVVKNKTRRPAQNNNYNPNNDNRNQNNDDDDNNRYQNNDYNRNQNNNYNRNQNIENNRNRYDSSINQNNDYNRHDNENSNQNSQKETPTRRPSPPARSTSFAGSSYIPTTVRTTSTTINVDQYTTAIHNYRTRNGQRQRQYTESDSPVYTISTPAPFRGSQQYNPPPNRQTNSGRYYSTTEAPQRKTENYPQQKSLGFDNYDIPKVKQTSTTAAQTQSTQYDTPKVKQSGTTAARSFSTPYDVPRTGSTAAQTHSSQYDTPRAKQTGTTAAQSFSTPNDVPRTTSNGVQTYNTQYDTPKVKQTGPTAGNYDVPRIGSTPSQNSQYDTPKVKQTASTAAQSYSTNYDIPKTKQPQTYDTQTKFDSTTRQYEVTKVKNSYSRSTFASENTDNYPTNNPKYNAFEKKPTTPFKQTENYPSTLSPKPFSVNNFPSTFAPRTNNAYSQIAHQSISYNKKGDSTAQTSSGSSQQSSTLRSTAFTQYTPTVPRISSTTPASRSNRFDETQYDDGSYSTKYDYDGDDKRDREEEFLKTAHSQNIAASRNELARTTKAQPSRSPTTRSDGPRPFSSTSRATEAPRASSEATERTQGSTKAAEHEKKVKDVSYDYAYYDLHTDSGEPDYDIETDIKKSTVKN